MLLCFSLTLLKARHVKMQDEAKHVEGKLPCHSTNGTQRNALEAGIAIAQMVRIATHYKRACAALTDSGTWHERTFETA